MIRPYLVVQQQQQTGDLLRPTVMPSDSQTTPAQDPFLRQIYALLDGQRAGVMVNVDWLADQLAVNRKTLFRNVLRHTRLSPADLIRQYYLHQAASLLREGYTVAEAAYKVGFTTPSHFAVVFKQHYGQTPKQFGRNRSDEPSEMPLIRQYMSPI